MLNQDIFDWLLLLARWFHIVVAISWIGTSVFFMWLDRSFVPNPESKREGHLGELWMVHGGGFYQVEKMMMGPTKVPEHLHWFKWESYWTWMSGMFLLLLTYYSGDGTYLLDPSISQITFFQAVCLALFSIFGSWFFYDFIWEWRATKHSPILGHLLTTAWFVVMTILLCETLSGRAAYIHIGGMLGTWMAGNVFMRIIPRQVKMVEATKKGEAVNQDWGKNAKSRSTHNTYFTLPVIFIMISNHFPATYGHDLNWLVLIILTLAGALVREYFVVRLSNPKRAKIAAVFGIASILVTIFLTKESVAFTEEKQHHEPAQEHVEKTVIKSLKTEHTSDAEVVEVASDSDIVGKVSGSIFFEGTPKKGSLLRLPSACQKQHKGEVYSDEVIVRNGKLENVFIRISRGLENKIYNDVPAQPVELDQKGCIYIPRVIAARINQEVVFINSDPIFHNVKSVSKNNPSFNVAMPKLNQRLSRSFKNPELFLETKCSVHPWMSAYIAIVDHPFFAITRSAGTFEIGNIPVGKYTLEVWHEVYGTLEQEFEVQAEGEQNNIVLDFTYTQKGNL